MDGGSLPCELYTYIKLAVSQDLFTIFSVMNQAKLDFLFNAKNSLQYKEFRFPKEFEFQVRKHRLSAVQYCTLYSIERSPTEMFINNVGLVLCRFHK